MSLITPAFPALFRLWRHIRIPRRRRRRLRAEKHPRVTLPPDPGAPVFEPLEPRLLLSASFYGLDNGDDEQARAQAAIELFDLSPALFVENQGQWDDDTVRFLHQGNGTNVSMSDTGPVFQLFRPVDAGPADEGAAEAPDDRLPPLDPFDRDREPPDLEMRQFSVGFVGAATATPVGLEVSDATFNYYLGDAADHRQGVSSYEVVAYEGLYDGIDLHTWGLRSSLKYEFLVAPGSDWTQIQVRYEGIEGLSINEAGELVVDLGDDWGTLVDAAPYIYQVIEGEAVEVAGQFVLLDDWTYGFEITGEYDASRELVIDPDLAWSTYLGGSGRDEGHGIAVDADGNVLVTGRTTSPGWVSGGWDTSYNYEGDDEVWGGDAFVVKLSPSGDHLWSTYLGGSGTDSSHGIAVDAAGNVLVTGETRSEDWVSGGWDTSFNYEGDDEWWGGDAFVVKLSPSGDHLWSTYLGGSGTDRGHGVAVDGDRNVLVTGFTDSPGWASGGWDTSYNGGRDGFVVKLTPAGGHLWSTYLGGISLERGHGIAVDAAGHILVTGYTGSPGWVSGGWDTSFNGGYDGFVVKLSPSGDHLWSTYLGGSGWDEGHGIAVDAGGDVLVTGWTDSPGWVSGGWDTAYNGGGDAFVAKIPGTTRIADVSFYINMQTDYQGLRIPNEHEIWVTAWVQDAHEADVTAIGFQSPLGVWYDLEPRDDPFWHLGAEWVYGNDWFDSHEELVAEFPPGVYTFVVSGPSGSETTSFFLGDDQGPLAWPTQEPVPVYPLWGQTGVSPDPLLQWHPVTDPHVSHIHSGASAASGELAFWEHVSASETELQVTGLASGTWYEWRLVLSNGYEGHTPEGSYYRITLDTRTSIPFLTEGAEPGDADLFIEVTDYTPGVYRPGDVMTFDVREGNQGDGLAIALDDMGNPIPIVSEVRFSTDTIWGNDDDIVLYRFTDGYTLPGAVWSEEGAALIVPDDVPAGTYYIAVFLDVHGVVPEVDKTNNLWWSVGPDFIIVTDDAEILARHLFYNNSAWDGNDAGPGSHNDAAIALDKTALLPGQTTGNEHVSGYSRGINGLMLDIAGLIGEVSLADFAFYVSDSGEPANWSAAPPPEVLAVREGDGVDGSDRIEIIWADGDIQDAWLAVTVLATGATGLAEDDTFYLANLRGDVDGDRVVGSGDLTVLLENFGQQVNLGPSEGDITADGRVGLRDASAMLGNWGSTLGVPGYFPIADTDLSEFAFSAAFDGTNYMVAVGSGSAAAASFQVSGHRLSPSGQRLGEPVDFGRSTTTVPGVVFANDRYLMVWTDDEHVGTEQGTDIYGQFVTPDGTLIGESFAIADFPGDQLYLGIAFDGINALVIYQDHTGLYGRLVSSTGVLVGEELQLTDGHIPGDSQAAVAFGDGGYVVTWLEGPCDGQYQVHAATVSPAGDIGPAVNVSQIASHHYNPVGIAHGNGRFFIYWHHNVQSGVEATPWNLYGRILDANGVPQGDRFQLTPAPGGDIALTNLCFDGTRFLLLWMQGGEGKPADLEDVPRYGQYWSSDGQPISDPFWVADGTIGGAATVGAGQILLALNTDLQFASEGEGGFASIIWGNVMGRFLSIESTPTGTSGCYATGDNQALAIAIDHFGQSGKTWSEGDFTGDGRVGLRDASVLLGNWGAGSTAATAQPLAVGTTTDIEDDGTTTPDPPTAGTATAVDSESEFDLLAAWWWQEGREQGRSFAWSWLEEQNEEDEDDIVDLLALAEAEVEP